MVSPPGEQVRMPPSPDIMSHLFEVIAPPRSGSRREDTVPIPVPAPAALLMIYVRYYAAVLRDFLVFATRYLMPPAVDSLSPCC